MSIRKVAGKLGLKKVSALFNITTSITLNNSKFKIPIINNMGLINLAVKDDFFTQLFKAIPISNGGCFIDIGVNVGQTLLKFRSCSNATYMGFEPNPGCVYYLNSLIAANNMRDTTIVPVGLSSSDAVAKFYLKGSVDTAGTIVNELRPDFYSAEEVNYVPVFAFDGLGVVNKKIELIKIDVEGAEYEVLLGMAETLKKQRPVVLCEILDSHNEENITRMQERANKLVEHMHSLDYKIYRIIHGNGNITPEAIDEVKLKKWSDDSWNMNDYMFLPKERSYADVVKN